MAKICMLVTNSVRKDPRVRKEAMSAISAGHDVTVIGIKDQNYDQHFIDNAPYKIVLIDYIKNPYKRFHPMWFIAGATKAVKYNRGFIQEILKVNPDLIHANDYDTLSAGFHASKKCNAKLVYDSHEVATGSILAEKYKPVRTYIRLKEGHIIRKAYAVISVSNAAAAYLAKLYSIPTPHVITNCPAYYELDAKTQRNPIFEVLYQGIMSHGRGYEEFIKSAKYSAREINYIIRGYGETKGELIELAKREGVDDRVIFAAPVEINELIPIAAKSAVGVVLTMPVCINYNMTVSNKLFEYIQAGLPVILSNVPEHVYLNDKYHIGIVIDEVTPEQIASAIDKLFKDRAFYDQIKTNVLKAKRELSWENFEEKLLDIYNANKHPSISE